MSSKFIGVALVMASCVHAAAAQADAAQSQKKLEGLRDEFVLVSKETTANFARIKALETTSDRPAYCQAMTVMIASQDHKVDVPHRINEVMKNEPGTHPDDAKSMADEENTARQGQAGLARLNQANCAGVASSTPDLDAVFNQMTAAESSGKKHLKAGLALIDAGDNSNGCTEIRAGLKDYRLQLDAAHILQSAFEKNSGANPDALAQFQSSTKSLEANVTDIESYSEVTCPIKP